MSDYMYRVALLVHRVLARHGSNEWCPYCPAQCRHCGDVSPTREDHTCPCPFSDADCPDPQHKATS